LRRSIWARCQFFAAPEGLLDGVASLDVPKLGPDEGCALSGLDVEELDDLEQVSINLHGHPRAKIVHRDHETLR